MPSLVSEVRAAGAALSFLTCVPLPAFDADDVRRAGAYFPLVGAGIGAMTGLVARRRSPAEAVAFETLLTGALHLDALADSFDALGTRDRERALEIMRDSRIGSFGAAAIGVDLLLKCSALSRVSVRRAAAAGAWSRTAPVVLSATLPYARAEGTGSALSRGSAGRAVLAVLLARELCGKGTNMGPFSQASAITTASGLFWRRRIGGVTGDTLGATIELIEIALL